MPVDGPERDKRERKVRKTDDERREQRRVDLPAGRLENGGSVIDDRIDARHMNQDGEAETYQNGASNAWPQQISPGFPLF